MAESTSHDKQIEAGIRFLRKNDKKLAAIIRRDGKLNLRSKRIGFDALVRIIIGQQLSGKAAETIFQRVRALVPNKRVSLKAFKRIKDNAYRSAGMSAAKTIAIRDLIEKIESGQLKIRNFSRMTDEEITEAVTQVKGIGPWSAQMYLMFTLGRLDVFAPGDLGIQKAICKLYGVEREKTDFDAIGERWRPYRTIACWYLWRSLDNAPLKGN